MKKKLCYLLGISDDLAFCAANVAIGINKHNKNSDYDIVILHSGLSDEDKRTLNLIPHCLTRKLDFKEEFIEAVLSSVPKDSKMKTKRDIMRLASFELFRMLSEYQYVVWLDADVLVRESLDDIIKFAPAAMASDAPWLIKDQFAPQFPGEGYNMELPAFRANMMVFQDTIPYDDIYDWCHKTVLEVAPYLKCTDQAVLNLAMHKFQLHPKMIMDDWISEVTSTDVSLTKVVHFGLTRKPWVDSDILVTYPEWYRNYRVWLGLGGTESVTYIIPRKVPRNIVHIIKELKNKSSERHSEYYHVFPFKDVEKDSSIIIWGMGDVGHQYLDQLRKTKYCKVLFSVDKKWKDIKADVDVYPPEDIKSMRHTKIVIANGRKDVADEIIETLSRWGIERKMIVWNDMICKA